MEILVIESGDCDDYNAEVMVKTCSLPADILKTMCVNYRKKNGWISMSKYLKDNGFAREVRDEDPVEYTQE